MSAGALQGNDAASAAGASGWRAFGIAAGGVAFLTLVTITAVALQDAPPADDPRVTLTLGPLETAPPAPPARATDPSSIRLVEGNLVFDRALIEESPDGPLPKIAADGRRPMTEYRGPHIAADAQRRIAIVMTGLGINQSATEDAIARLPAGVSLAFVPDATGLQGFIDSARGRGHEVLLEVPMEPLTFSAVTPGPRFLMVGETADENMARLRFNLTRATGYVGIGNHYGGRFLRDAEAVAPVMSEVANRGLLFFDNGRGTGSAAVTMARTARTPIASARIPIDDVQTDEAITQKLTELEVLAESSGMAIGVAFAYPGTIERIEAWSVDLQERGFTLAPVTAVTEIPVETP